MESSVSIDRSTASTFRLINVAGRAALDLDGHVYDLARVSGDDRLADPMAAIAVHAQLGELTERCAEVEPDAPLEGLELGPPVPRPRQIFGIGLNYRDHAAESGMDLPPAPLTFTKFPTCLAGPTAEIRLSGSMVDWEAEIVVVIGTTTRSIAVDDAWSAVAGLTLGQDISDRAVQLTGSPPQFSLGKSFASYGPIGPAVVPPSAFADPDDIGLWCEVSGERVQDARTDQLIFPIPVLVAYLSSICELCPGDLIFTGTPAGVGMSRGRFLSPGDVITTGAEVIGELRNPCVAGAGPITV